LLRPSQIGVVPRRATNHAVNHGSKTNAVEPALEIREMMFGGKLTIAGHNTELLEEMRNYHRDEDFKIVKQRDDVVSAMRYAIMMRRQGKPLFECEGIGLVLCRLPHSARRAVASPRASPAAPQTIPTADSTFSRGDERTYLCESTWDIQMPTAAIIALTIGEAIAIIRASWERIESQGIPKSGGT
jgi:hypothetical protein